MKRKRGPKSQAELQVVSAQPLGRRPEPPLGLNERAAFEWQRCVDRMPSDWFTAETLSVLQAYCEHVAEGEAIQTMIEQVRELSVSNDEAFERYKKLTAMKEAQTRAALSCATKLRMTQQSSYTTQAAGTSKGSSEGGRKPWE